MKRRDGRMVRDPRTVFETDAGAGRRGSAVRALGLFIVLGLAVLAPLACSRKTPTPDAAGGADADAVLVGDRPGLPARGGGLASLAVFPAVDAPLKLVRSEPAAGAEGVSTAADSSAIVLRFNHPVVALASLETQRERSAPVEIRPAIAGEGEWLDTATWIFRPGEDLAPMTDYRLKLDSELEDLFGQRLAEVAEIGFRTAGPAVLATLPESGAVDASVGRAISVTFSLAMDRTSTEAAFRLSRADGAEAIPGRMTWDGATMLFTPRAPLEPDADFQASLGAGARAAGGKAGLESEHAWSFRSAPLPKLVKSEPADGDRQTTRMRGGDLGFYFNTPMDRQSLTVTLQPTITNMGIWWSEDGREAHVHGGWLASQAYTATLPGETVSRSGARLGQDHVIRFDTAPIAPMLNLHTTGDFSLFDAGAPVRVYADAVNVPAAEFNLASVDRGSFLRLTTGEYRWQVRESFRPQAEARRWQVDVSAPVDVARRVSTTLGIGPDGLLKPGLYDLSVGAVESERKDHSRSLLLVSDLNLSLKLAPDEVLVWATRLRDGRPAAGVPIAVHEDQNAPLAEGLTDADGIFRAPIARKADSWQPVVALSEKEGRVTAAVSSEWADGIEAYAFNIGYDPAPREYYGTLYTDRPIYRPGQQVYYRGILRADADATYSLPDIETLRVIVRDPDYETLLETDLSLDDFGALDGSIALPATARLGSYSIEMQREDTQGNPYTLAEASFRVAAYRKPQFEISVETDRPQYRQGETIQVSVAANYYFGGPVAGAKAQWRLLADDFFFSPPEQEGQWDWIDYDLTESRYHDAQGGVVAEGEGETDAEGRLSFEIPADLGEFPLSQVFTIDVELSDLDNQAVAGRGSVVVHKADLYLGLRPKAYLAESGQPAGFEIQTLSAEGAPIAEQSVDLSLYRREWYSVREKREDGAFYWTSHYTDTLVAESPVQSDSEGRAEAALKTGKPGVHRLVAKGQDAAGNAAQSATYLWVTGKGYVNWRQENNDRIELVADKKSYAPGETARILIPAPFEGAEALITVERGSIRQVRQMRLEGNGETIDLPIEADFAPNVYVSVILVKGVGPDNPIPQIKLGYTNLAVSIAERELRIEVSPDRAGEYGPRQHVTYTITARDHAGKPVRAALSAALVDKALLALTEDATSSLQESFYGQRMLSVGTAAGLTRSGQRLERELAAEKKGGGGGLGQEAGTVRRLMQDTAFWSPALYTDAQGRASFGLRLPDNLTTWRLDLKGVTGADTLVGSADHEIQSSQDLLIRPVLPRFLVVGDTLQLEAVVQNRSQAEQAVTVDLSGIGLELEGKTERKLEVPAGGKRKLVWQARVLAEGLMPSDLPEAFGSARVHFEAEGEAGDAIEVDLPVYQFSGAQVVATAGEVDGKLVERIDLPADADRSQGGLTVEVEASLAAAGLAGRDWLSKRPPECVDDRASELLVNLAIWDLAQKPGGEALLDAALREEIAGRIDMTVQQLTGMQGGSGSSGGWNWCGVVGAPQPWLSAKALLALGRAERAGFTVRESTLAAAVDFLLSQLNRPADAEASWDLDQRAFITWALAERGSLAASRALGLFERREALSDEALAILALALSRSEDEASAAAVETLLTLLSAKAQRSATGSFWKVEAERAAWTFGSGTRATALAILALSELDPEASVLPGALRWLMHARQEGHWPSDEETTWSVLGLAAYAGAKGELEADYSYKVELNRAIIGSGSVNASNLDQALSLEAPAAELKDQNELVIRRDGPGQLYYQARLELYRPAESLPAEARGIVLGREYFAVDPATFEASGEAIDRARIGDFVEVRLSLVAEDELRFLRLEDHFPAGFEAVDTSLRSTSAAARGPALELADSDMLPEDMPWWMRPWWLAWSDSQLRDDRALLLAERLEAGSYTYRYLLRASVAGNYRVRPAQAELGFFPEVFGRSAGGIFTIEPAP